MWRVCVGLRNALVVARRTYSSLHVTPETALASVARPSSRAKDLRRISPEEVLPVAEYAQHRKEYRALRVQAKQHRRVEIGPFASVAFMNYDIIWTQIHEMLLIEKGGQAQVKDELDAYNPLLPQGNDLVAVLMVEIDNKPRRERVLRTLTHIDRALFLLFDQVRLQAVPIGDDDRTRADGKTSAVHFLRFEFTPERSAAFRATTAPVSLLIQHKAYHHAAVLSPATVRALQSDLVV